MSIGNSSSARTALERVDRPRGAHTTGTLRRADHEVRDASQALGPLEAARKGEVDGWIALEFNHVRRSALPPLRKLRAENVDLLDRRRRCEQR